MLYRKLIAVLALIGLAGCAASGPDAPIGERLAEIDAIATVWKTSGARVFAASQVPLSAKVWTRTEFGIGGDGYVQLFAIWEPDE